MRAPVYKSGKAKGQQPDLLVRFLKTDLMGVFGTDLRQ
jgi:hypothetical protein